MPIDYSLYHPEWKTRIRPDILNRAGNCCEVCGLPNYSQILRGNYWDRPVYQNDDGQIFCQETGEHLGDTYVGEVAQDINKGFIRVVLTVAHLDHDITNNNYENLKALCQLHHLNHDRAQHKKTRKLNKRQLELL